MFIVNVWFLDHNSKKWVLLAEKLKLETLYKESEMIKALRLQHKEVWNKIPVWKDERDFTFREALDLEILEWVHSN